MVVPAGRSTPEMKASSNNPKKVKIAQETIKLVGEISRLLCRFNLISNKVTSRNRWE